MAAASESYKQSVIRASRAPRKSTTKSTSTSTTYTTTASEEYKQAVIAASQATPGTPQADPSYYLTTPITTQPAQEVSAPMAKTLQPAGIDTQAVMEQAPTWREGVIKPAREFEDMSRWEKTKLIAKRYFSLDLYREALGTAVGAGTYARSQYMDIFGGIGVLFSPLKGLAPTPIEAKTTTMKYPTQSTIIAEGAYDPFAPKTTYERLQEQKLAGADILPTTISVKAGRAASEQLQAEFDIEATQIVSGYEARVKAGEIRDVGRAQAQMTADLKALQEQKGIEWKKVYETELTRRGIESSLQYGRGYRTAVTPKYDIEKIGTTAAVIATTFVAPVAAGALLYAGGTSQMWAGFAEKDPLKAMGGAAMTFIGMELSLSALSAQITQAELKAVMAQKPRLLTGERIVSGKYVRDITYDIRTTPYAKAYTRQEMVAIGKGKTFKLAGRADTKIYAKEYWTDQPLIAGMGERSIGQGYFLKPGVGGWTPSGARIVTTKEYEYMFRDFGAGTIKGKILLYPYGGERVTGLYGGITKQTGKYIVSASGKMTGAFKGQATAYKFDADTFAALKIKAPAAPKGFETGAGARLKTAMIPPSTTTLVTAKPAFIATITKAPTISVDKTLLGLGVGAAVITRSEYKQAPYLKQRGLEKQIPAFATSFAAAQLISPQLAGRTRIGQRAMQAQIPVIVPKTKQVTILAQQPVRGARALAAGTPGLGLGFPGFGVISFPFKRPSAGIGKMPAIGRIKTKAVYGYTPSYKALAFGIKGKQPAPFIGKRWAGFEMRPITKGWFSRLFKRRKKIKIIKVIGAK